MNKTKLEKKKRTFPHVFLILIGMILLAYIATLIVPSSSFERVQDANGRMLVDPDSFEYISKQYLLPTEIFLSIPKGLIASAMIMVTIFMIGGSWEIIHETGTVTALVSKIASKMKGKELFIFPILMFIFGLIVSLLGALELSIVFLPAIMPLMLAFGFDLTAAVGCVLVGACAGFATSITNPFTVGIAQSIAGLPPYSGMGMRIITGLIFYITGVIYVFYKAKQSRDNPSSSIVYEETLEFKKNLGSVHVDFEVKHMIIGLTFVAGLGLILYGVLKLGWFMNEMGAVFLGIGVIASIVGKVDGTRASQAFIRGCQNVISAALVVGLARGIVVIIEGGQIIDTMVYGLTTLLNVLPKQLTVIGVFIFQSLFNFVVNSGSGKTLITMPILTPMADILGISRQVFVLTTILGDGITNILYPTSGILMACIGYSNIPYNKWFRYIIPLILIWSVISMVVLVIAQTTGY